MAWYRGGSGSNAEDGNDITYPVAQPSQDNKLYSEEDINNIQQLYGILMRDPLAGEYLQAEMRFSMMMNDVYKIIGEAAGMGDMAEMFKG